MCLCTHAVGVPNPYAIEQIIVAAALISTFSLWASVKPPAVYVIRLAAALAAVTTICAMVASSLGLFSTVEPECKLALQASLLLTCCLVAELIAVWRRERIPRAVARWFR